MLLEFLVLSSVVLHANAAAPPYAYGVQTDPEHGKICSGKYLNPINYADANIVENTFHNLTFHGWEVIPDNMQIINNGQTVVLKMDFRQGQDPKVYLGPIKTEAPYDLDHLYFYFLEPEPYPSELHVIMRRLEGHDEDFGLAVLAFSILPSQYYNAPYDELTQSLEFIQGIGDTAHLMKRMSIRSFVSQDLDTYYSYEGSLITSCSKRVLWVDFVDPIDVLSYQLAKFRKLNFSESFLEYKIQTINNQTIYKNYPRPTPNAANNIIFGNWLTGLLCLFFTSTKTFALYLEPCDY